jgi:septal ring factor EnvC (AmiA/AmiB activator)
MEAMMEEPVREGEEPMSPGRAVREVVRASTFLEVVGLQSKKKLRVPVCSQLEALMAELKREKAESRQVEQIVEQQRREMDALREQVKEARDSNRSVEAQLEHLRKESAGKASLVACLMSNFEGGQVHPSSLTFE